MELAYRKIRPDVGDEKEAGKIQGAVMILLEKLEIEGCNVRGLDVTLTRW